MNAYCRNAQRGFGLVELMIAMVLSLIIGIALIQILLSQKSTYSTQGELAGLQENARFAFDRISKDVRLSGYWGCNSTVVDPSTPTSQSTNLLNQTGSATYDHFTDNALTATSSVLTLSFSDPSRPMPLNSSTFPTAVTGTVNAGLIKMASDCNSGILFTGADLPATPFQKNLEVFPLEVVKYQISGGALYRTTINSSALTPDTAIIDSGVTSITYWMGRGAGSYVDTYFGADVYSGWGANSWWNVRSIKVQLVLAGKTIGPRTFTSVIAVRNRLP